MDLFAAAAEFADDGADEGFCVSEEHERAIEVVERIVYSSKSGGHAALYDHDRARLIHVQNGHAEDGATGIGARGGIGDIVCTDHQGHIGLRKIAVDFVHVQQLVVGNVGFREQDIHVSGHATGDRMDSKLYVHAALGEGVVQLAHLMLRLGYGHSIAWNYNHFASCGENRGGFFGSSAAHRPRFLLANDSGLLLTESAEEDVGERAVHGFRHVDGEDEAGSSVQRAGNDEQFAIEHEAHGG